jgi:hypothetical protein
MLANLTWGIVIDHNATVPGSIRGREAALVFFFIYGTAPIEAPPVAPPWPGIISNPCSSGSILLDSR